MRAREVYELVENAGDAAFVVGPDRRIYFWSRKAEELLGFTSEEAVSKYCEELLHGQDESGCRVCGPDCRMLEMAHKTGQVPSFDLHTATAAGQFKWLSISVIVVYPNDGPSPMSVHLVRDIDSRKKIELITRKILTEIGGLSGPRAAGILDQTNSHQPPVDLTPREVSILRLLSLGKKTSDISEELHISTATVRNHVQHSLEKLRAHTRLEAVIRASRMGLI